jgi:hypothetical protein
LLRIKVVAREGRSIPPSSRKAESPTGDILIFPSPHCGRVRVRGKDPSSGTMLTRRATFSHRGRRKIKAGMTIVLETRRCAD